MLPTYPAKTTIGRISKQLLEVIMREVRDSTGLTQWRSTGEALKWFSDIKDKHKKRLMQFDVVEFYPSISEELLIKALDFANQHTKEPISEENREIILHSRKALLFTKNEQGASIPWVKKIRNV